MREYAAIVGVFWQKRRFLPGRLALGLSAGIPGHRARGPLTISLILRVSLPWSQLAPGTPDQRPVWLVTQGAGRLPLPLLNLHFRQ